MNAFWQLPEMGRHPGKYAPADIVAFDRKKSIKRVYFPDILEELFLQVTNIVLDKIFIWI